MKLFTHLTAKHSHLINGANYPWRFWHSLMTQVFIRGYKWVGDFYYALFTLGEEIYRYFVPVLNNDTNQACLYEVIEGKIYTPLYGNFASWG